MLYDKRKNEERMKKRKRCLNEFGYPSANSKC